MKKIKALLLITLLILTPVPTNIKAENASFYEGDYIKGVYMTRQNNKSKLYQLARFIYRSNDQQFAYCIEPFASFDADQKNYESLIDPNNITKETWNRVSMIAYFGYNYDNHTEPKWYAITQLLIWQAVDPNSQFYFTDKLNGNAIDPFQAEIQEINTLIDNFQKKPSFHEETIDLVLGETYTLTDIHNVIQYYHATSPTLPLKILGNQLLISGTVVTEQNINLTRAENIYHTPPLFYYHPQSQDIMIVGNPTMIDATFKVNVQETEIKIKKVDQETKLAKGQGEAKLENATFELLDDNHELLETLTIGKDKQTTKKNLPYGTYYLKEKTAGEGYQLNSNTYSFTLSKEQPNVDITIENKVIKQRIELFKMLESNKQDTRPEENVTFIIYDTKEQQIATITTDQNGYASIELPYGSYIIKQQNTLDGYQKIADFYITVTDQNTPLIYHLTDLKIPVPDTYKNTYLLFSLIGMNSYVL